jgi:hypothetical protein
VTAAYEVPLGHADDDVDYAAAYELMAVVARQVDDLDVGVGALKPIVNSHIACHKA